MKPLFLIGMIVLILGALSFFVPIPHTENHGIKVGDASIGVQTHDTEHVSPALSGALVVVGAVMMIAAGRKS
jgi:hypothetical protein